MMENGLQLSQRQNRQREKDQEVDREAHGPQ